MLIYLISYIGSTIFAAICLWVAAKISAIDGSFADMAIISAISALFTLIPYVGAICSSVVMFVLLCKRTNADFWPDAVLMVIVSKVIGLIGVLYISKYFNFEPIIGL